LRGCGGGRRARGEPAEGMWSPLPPSTDAAAPHVPSPPTDGETRRGPGAHSHGRSPASAGAPCPRAHLDVMVQDRRLALVHVLEGPPDLPQEPQALPPQQLLELGATVDSPALPVPRLRDDAQPLVQVPPRRVLRHQRDAIRPHGQGHEAQDVLVAQLRHDPRLPQEQGGPGARGVHEGGCGDPGAGLERLLAHFHGEDPVGLPRPVDRRRAPVAQHVARIEVLRGRRDLRELPLLQARHRVRGTAGRQGGGYVTPRRPRHALTRTSPAPERPVGVAVVWGASACTIRLPTGRGTRRPVT